MEAFEIEETITPSEIRRRVRTLGHASSKPIIRSRPSSDEVTTVAASAPLPSYAVVDSFDHLELHEAVDPSRWHSPDGAKSAGAAKAPPPWDIGLSKQFKKDTAALDRKLMGRVFEVLAEISDWEIPFKTRGDTFKPLTGELTGCWRYRIGDSRLLLKPEQEQRRINALAFAARGNVYD
ncbi:hypothetical protein D3C81_1172580 [compost metagenome]